MVGLHVRDDLQADRSSELNTTTTIVLILSAVFVGLRFWARYVRIGYGLDDWLTVVALVRTLPPSRPVSRFIQLTIG
jgi:hypothetical protein